jgi:hypothetical protein
MPLRSVWSNRPDSAPDGIVNAGTASILHSSSAAGVGTPAAHALGMKKSNLKKLHINQERVRTLIEHQFELIVGGIVTSTSALRCTTVNPGCPSGSGC